MSKLDKTSCTKCGQRELFVVRKSYYLFLVALASFILIFLMLWVPLIGFVLALAFFMTIIVTLPLGVIVYFLEKEAFIYCPTCGARYKGTIRQVKHAKNTGNLKHLEPIHRQIKR